MIIEYKLQRMADGSVTTPPFVENGGYFPDSRNTFIGFSPSSKNRNYKIPDNVVRLTLEELKARCDGLCLKNEDESFMSSSEVSSLVDLVVSKNDLD